MTNKAYVAIQSVAGKVSPAMESLYDSFGGSSLDTTKWDVYVSGSGTSSGEGSGSLNLTTTSGDTAVISCYSKYYYDLTDSYAYVHVTSAGSGNATEFHLLTASSGVPDTNYPEVRFVLGGGGGTLWATYVNSSGGTTDLWSSAWSSSYAWWRIRESGGTIYWDTSSDGATWTNRASIASSLVFSSVTSLYAALSNDNGGTGGTSSFAEFNSPASSYVYTPGTVTASAVALSAVNAVEGTWTVEAGFSYGDSDDDIRHALVTAVQAAAGDTTLEVEFVS